MTEPHIRKMEPEDRHEVAELIYVSINHWYAIHGRPTAFRGGPRVTEVFYQVYESLDPGCGIVAANGETGRLMGSCFYHPRPHHVSLGIMNVHPNYFGCGAGRRLLQTIIDFARTERKPLRLTQSALNLDSFSLYNKAGFVPRYAYQDMFLQVPENGLNVRAEGVDRVRDATRDDTEQGTHYALHKPNPHTDTAWQDHLAQLSDRELTVFRAIGHGNSTRDIAQDLGISAKTVDTYRRRIKAKLGIDHTTRLTVCAVSWYLQHGQLHE